MFYILNSIIEQSLDVMMLTGFSYSFSLVSRRLDRTDGIFLGFGGFGLLERENWVDVGKQEEAYIFNIDWFVYSCDLWIWDVDFFVCIVF